MNKIYLSLAAASLIAATTATADIDVKTGGQAVLYYQTADNGDNDLFNHTGSRANAALQINLNADLGNDYGLGIQGTGLSTLGLEDNLVDNVMQAGGGDLAADSGDYFAITKAYITKKITCNTLAKLGRQELPKALSPFAFSEGWNVIKNTFDAMVVINTDIPDTTVVGAYVNRTNGNGLANDMSTFTKIGADEGAYMLTLQNKSLAGFTPTFSYYNVSHVATAMWLDLQTDLGKMAGLPVNIALQGGQMDPDGAGDSTTGLGIKISGKVAGIALTGAYTTVDDGALPIHNLGTGVKTPLYTQMILNQGAIKSDSDTFMLKGVAPVGPGKVIAQFAMSSAGDTTGVGLDDDYQELDLIYKAKIAGTTFLAAYVYRGSDNDNAFGQGNDTMNVLRFWARYNF
ncbi:MAG: hypothetical protein B6D59_05465 [Campylobacteraceae bacterium 4484_4]|nr:MAG: hypothetical protein B6D59_05465 [Campylobacteraceae bacterium 4484_4]